MNHGKHKSLRCSLIRFPVISSAQIEGDYCVDSNAKSNSEQAEKKKRFAAVQKHSKNRKRRDDMEIHIKKGLDALQTETVLRLLSQTVWACNRKKEAIMESWKHSICYGAYTADGKQI